MLSSPQSLTNWTISAQISQNNVLNKTSTIESWCALLCLHGLTALVDYVHLHVVAAAHVGGSADITAVGVAIKPVEI